ncbi:hypothetical protein D3C73_645080 [compost metagenome]
MSGQGCRQVYCSWSFGAIKTPNCFGQQGIHIHCFRTITPTGCDRKRYTDILPLKLIGTVCGFFYTTNTGIRNNADHRCSIWIFQFGVKQCHDSFSHIHCCLFQRFTYTAQATIDNRANTNFRICFHICYFLG